MNKKTKLLIGSLIGALMIFLFPIFPVPLNNDLGVYSGLWWQSGLMQINLSLKNLIGLEIIGGLVGFGLTLIYVGGVD